MRHGLLHTQCTITGSPTDPLERPIAKCISVVRNGTRRPAPVAECVTAAAARCSSDPFHLQITGIRGSETDPNNSTPQTRDGRKTNPENYSKVIRKSRTLMLL